MSQPRVVAITGSLRDESYTHTALRYALAAAEEAGAETGHIDLREVDLPLYDPDFDERGDSESLKRRVRAADGLLIGTPVYHSSYSSAFKNLHDYLGYDEFEDTVCGLFAIAGGGSYGETLEHLRGTIRGCHGWVLPRQVGIQGASGEFEADPDAIDGRRFVDPGLQERVETVGAEVAHHAGAERIPARN